MGKYSDSVSAPGRLGVPLTRQELTFKNRAIVDTFLASHPEFNLRNAGEVLAQQKIVIEVGECLQLFPQVHGTDGFFAAVLERNKTIDAPLI